MNSESDVAEKSSSVSLRLQDDHISKSQQQGPLERSASNVSKLVSAFESSLPKVLQVCLETAYCCMWFLCFAFYTKFTIWPTWIQAGREISCKGTQC